MRGRRLRGRRLRGWLLRAWLPRINKAARGHAEPDDEGESKEELIPIHVGSLQKDEPDPPFATQDNSQIASVDAKSVDLINNQDVADARSTRVVQILCRLRTSRPHRELGSVMRSHRVTSDLIPPMGRRTSDATSYLRHTRPRNPTAAFLRCIVGIPLAHRIVYRE